ncbi:hypothetical protein AB0B57_22430 [Micromonospora sp. NPDC049101]|uniref:hypothetical protein n=1 Tax=Micromonospora sp. NPDC049101 TaxID=3155032 RepID=UPI0033E711BC
MLTLRGVKIAFTGKDGRTASVTFDRYTRNLPADAYNTDDAFRAHAGSSALSSVIQDPNYGAAWVLDYQVIDIPDPHRS